MYGPLPDCKRFEVGEDPRKYIRPGQWGVAAPSTLDGSVVYTELDHSSFAAGIVPLSRCFNGATATFSGATVRSLVR